MWHEARRREKATQKLFNDHKKRAAGKRREEGRATASSLLQVHGIKSTINLDPGTHQQASGSLVVWQGDKKTTIDRFDVRATLNSLPSAEKASAARAKHHRQGAGEESRGQRSTILDADESESMRKLLNYERFRLLIQNDINRVPEATRLGLAARSESLSEAKMRKLEKNYFGTSGETALPGEYAITSHRSRNSNQTNNRVGQQSQARSQGAAIGFSYSSGVDETDSGPPPGQKNLASAVVDLDDYEDMDLDCVDKRLEGSQKIDEIIAKYGLDCDELNLLIEITDDKTNCLPSTKEIIRKLKLARDKRKDVADVVESDLYGPALPPEQTGAKPRVPRAGKGEEEGGSSGGNTPIAQRSPRAGDLPESADKQGDKFQGGLPSPDKDVTQRSKTEDDEHRDDGSLNLAQVPPPATCDESPGDEKPRGGAAAVNSCPTLCTNSKGLMQSVHESSLARDRLDPASARRDTSPTSGRRSRRGSTPLAYKRYRRSSRSLSRERRASRRHRSRSSSSATSSSSSSSRSSSSCSSTTSSSESSSSSSSISSSTDSYRVERDRRVRPERTEARHRKRPRSRHKRTSSSRSSRRRGRRSDSSGR